MKITLFICSLVFFFINCNLTFLTDDSKPLTTVIDSLFKQTKKVSSLSFSSSSNVFDIQFDDSNIKEIDGIKHSLDVLPSQISNPKISIPKGNFLYNSSISILPSSIEKSDKTGIYSYAVILNKKKIKVSYQFLDQRGFDAKALLKFKPSDIKLVDGVTSSLDKLPTDTGVVPRPVFNPKFPKYGLKFYTISIVSMPDGSDVVRDNSQGKYEYKVKIATKNASREMIVYYRFQSQKEKNAVSSQPTIIKNLKENIFNSISESDIKSIDNISIGNRIPSTSLSPSFLSSGYNIKSLNVNVSLKPASIVQSQITGEYSYVCNLSYVLSPTETLTRSIKVVYTAGSKIGDISENDIKSIDNITPNSTKLASKMSNPPLFNTGSGVGGVTGINVSLDGSNLAIVDDVSGLYNYSVKVEKSNVSKTINIRYNGFLTNRQKEINALHTITESDIKGVDNISDNLSDRSSKLASSETKTITFGSTSLKGVTSFTTNISTPASSNDNTGVFTYGVTLSKYGVTTSEIVVNYTGYDSRGSYQLKQDQPKISQFNALDLMAMDNINVSRSIFPTDAAPTFTNQDKYGLTSSDYTIALQTLSNGKTYKLDKNNGTFYYKAIVSTTSGATKEISVNYSGFLTTAEDILNNDNGKLANFTESNVKGWDGITESSSTYPSDFSSIPTFTGLPSALHGLTGFKVELLGRSALVDDPTGKYQYDVKISNAAGTASRTLTITYSAFAKRDFKLSFAGNRMIVSHLPVGYNPNYYSLQVKNGSSPFDYSIPSGDIKINSLGSGVVELKSNKLITTTPWQYIFAGVPYRVDTTDSSATLRPNRGSDVITLEKSPLYDKNVWMRDKVNGAALSNNDKLGNVIALSGNGKVMLASKGSDKVVIYEKDSNGNWQYKQTLTGYVGAGLSTSDSISHDGSRFIMSNNSSNATGISTAVFEPFSSSINIGRLTWCSSSAASYNVYTGHTSVIDRQSDKTWKTSMNIGSCVLQSYSKGASLSQDGKLVIIRSKLSNNAGRIEIIHLSSSINYRDSKKVYNSSLGLQKEFTGANGDKLGMLGVTTSGDSKYVIAHSQSQSYATSSPSKSKINTYYLDDTDNTWKTDISFDINISTRALPITNDWDVDPKDIGSIVFSQGTANSRTLAVSFPKINSVKIFQLNCTSNNRCTVDTSKNHQIQHTSFGYSSSDDPRFGTNVRISDDGLRLLISAVEANNFKSAAQGINAAIGGGTTSQKGVVFLLTRSSVNSTTWTTLSARFDSSKEFGIFRPINPSGVEYFGYGLGFDASGKAIVVGSPLHASGMKGKIYSFK